MNLHLALENVLSPPILFFLLGMLAVLFRSDLDIPHPLPKLFSIYLLIAIGLHGGHELASTGSSLDAFKFVSASAFMSIAVPVYGFLVLKPFIDVYNAVALAASYGSIGVVTFIAALSFLQQVGISYSLYTAASLAIMEPLAIVSSLILLHTFTSTENNGNAERTWRKVLKEALFNSSVFLLLGSLLIGFILKDDAWKTIEPFYSNLFRGLLTLFLLDLGIISARRINDIKKVGRFLFAYGILFSIFNGMVALVISKILDFSKGDTLLFISLCISASYTAVPAVMRLSVPEANPGIYVTVPLAITLPFNLIIGIPMYFFLIEKFM